MLSYFVYAVDYNMQTYIVNPKTFFSFSRTKFRRNVQKLVIFLSKNRKFSTDKCLFIRDNRGNIFCIQHIAQCLQIHFVSFAKNKTNFLYFDICIILFFSSSKVIQNTTINTPCYFLLISGIIQLSFFFCMRQKSTFHQCRWNFCRT